jgi:TRAP-type C4-dicarboxylate transport system substrate-binding protein
MISRRLELLALLLLLGSAFAPPASAQEVRIKLGTLAPVGSTWHTLLLEMGETWKQVSDGKVQLKIYAGGTQGNEGEMIRKMSIGQLQAAAITAVGMRVITPEPQAEDAPGLIESYEEYDYVHERMRADLEAAVAKKGYVVLNWGEVGFVHLFSTEPYRTPADFSKGKVFSWEGDPASEAAWKAAGLRPVVLSSTDMITSLQTKMIDIVADPPLYAYTAHIFERANHMLDLKWGFLTGATVVRREAWEKVPADLRAKLLAIAQETGAKVVQDVRKQNEEALEQMKKKGLQVIAGDPALWKPAFDRAETVIRTRVVGAATYDKVRKLRDEYRAQHKR